MEILICVKQVPDDSVEVRLDPKTNQPDLSKALPMTSAFDSYGQEMAVRYVEANGGAVHVVSVGDSGNQTSLRSCLSVGAKDAFLVSDPKFAGADGTGIAKILAAAVPKVEALAGAKFDVIICGMESTDSINGHVGAILAEKLGYAYVSGVVEMEPCSGGLRVKQEAGGGYRVYEIPTPALITASKPDYDPRYPSIKSKMAARKAKIATISAADIGLDAAAVAPKVEYLGFSAPPKRAAGVKVQEAEPVDAVNKAMEILIAAKVI